MSAADGVARVPRATYRLQLHAGFTFRDAAAIVPYLHELGVSHCYCSPYLKARPGSMHGYDVVDHRTLNPEIGTQEDFEHFVQMLGQHGMGQIVDIVPNHIAVMGRENPWWLDVLENGPASEFARFFDIDWYPLRTSLTGKVLLPVLGQHYGAVLESGELEVIFDEEKGAFALQYYEHLFPVDPREFPRILLARMERLPGFLEDGSSATAFESLITGFANLPQRSERLPEKLAERRRDKEIHKQRLAKMVSNDAGIAAYIRHCLELYNDARPAAMAARLHDLLEAQAYRLAYWRVASHEINYRRFFDINDLASLRMEDAAVFDAVHGLLLDLVADGQIHGARVDHPDGLYDPAGYFRRLSEEIGRRTQRPFESSPPVYVVAEKILAHNEPLRAGWRVHGTTGYDFAALLCRLFVYPNGMPQLDKLYADFIGARTTLRETAYRAKKLIMQTSLASELNVLLAELDRIAEADPHTRDFGLGGLRNALFEIVACLSVYRTYVSSMKISKADAAFVDEAVADAKRRTEAADTSVFDFVGDVLTLRAGAGRGETYRKRLLDFVMKLQQYTGPVAAKGVEDTAFYRYNRLVALNEVGGDPDLSSLSIEAFHRANRDRLRRWPHTMLASSTHDNKRSEDVRARITVLSELADEWTELAQRWAETNEQLKMRTDPHEAWPDRNTEYLLYQTLLGAWPAARLDGEARRAFVERIQAYMSKAIKEAKAYTSWINPNADYEQAVASFVEALLDERGQGAFLEELARFRALLARVGAYNTLAQTLLKLTVPGVPDIYQGNELMTFDLVDPDNRRPVDFNERRARLEKLCNAQPSAALARKLLERMDEGSAKLHVTRAALDLRRARPALFARGEYVPLAVRGQLQVYLCAFARRLDEDVAVVLAPRWFATLTDRGRVPPLGADIWKDTCVELPSERPLRDLLTGETLGANGGETIEVGRLLAHFPVALLSTA